MTLGRFRTAYLLLLSLSASVSLFGQEAPKVELFGGYSYLRLTDQPRTLLKPADLNGWNGSVKLNVTPRIGLVADLGGHYGQRELTPFTLNSVNVPLRQYTYLFGPEGRILRTGRMTVNVRALMGVAHTNGLPPSMSRLALPSANSTFAASFGGSVDYRISDRLSYRIVQPEVLLTRTGSSATNNWNQYNFRLSTGLVFTSAETSFGQSSLRHFSVGVVGGVALTDAFGHESTGFIIGPDGSIEPIRSRSYSTVKDYVIGPMLEIGLPWRGVAVEIDALYRPMNLTMAGVNADGSLHSVSPATVVTWQLPLLAKYRFGSGSLNPLVEVGPSFRVAGNLNDAAPSPYGGTAGLGVEAQLGKVKIAPVGRYTHWAADPDFAGSRSKRNQVELLVGLSF